MIIFRQSSRQHLKNGGAIMSRKGENIYKRKDGRWEGRYIQSYGGCGKAKYGYVYARTYNEAKQLLIDKKASNASPNIAEHPSSIKYEDLLDEWLQFSRINVKESTYAHYFHLINTHIKPSLGKYPVSKISTQLVEAYIDSQMKHGRLDGKGGLSAKTTSDILAIIKSSFEYAGYHDIHVICNLSKLGIKQQKKGIRVLTIKEQAALISVLTEEMDLFKFGTLFALYTGIRIGELCALQWENISLDNATLKIQQTLQRIQDTNKGASTKTKIVITTPKSKCSVRDIPIPMFLVEMARQFSNNPKAYILSGDKSKYVEPRTMQNHFKQYVEACGIEDANFHALRHTFATRCIELGFEIKSLSEILGHANVNITLNRYVHSSFDLKCANMNKLSLPK